jgi:hypothetical protein
MKTTLNIDDDLLERAREATGIKEKTALIHRGLETLVQMAAAERLIRMAGKVPGVEAGRRRRTSV